MSNENQTQYLKTPHVLKILNREGVACEEKLDELRNLIGGKGLKLLPPGEELPEKTQEAPVESNPSSAPTATQTVIEKIVSEISGVKEKQLARSLLNEIDRSDYISFDPDNLEIIVDGENIKFSNIKNLVQYCISANPSHLPLGIALFLQCLIKIKIPSELLRHGDALGIRESLIKIEELRSRGLSGGETTAPSEAAPEVAPDANEGGVDEGGGRGKKRTREDDGDDDDDDDDDDDAPELKKPRKTYGLSQGSLDKIRTAPKLQDAISSSWRDAMGGSSSRKRKVTLDYPEAEEEGTSGRINGIGEWNKKANPTSRSKRKKVTFDFAEAEAEWGDSGRKKNGNQRE